jgi:glycosyltransferase involved in cell wall biosynthesis
MNESDKEFHVLIISNGFPNYFNALDGIFYFDQAVALKKIFPTLKVGFLSVNPIGIKDFLKRPSFCKLGLKNYTDANVQIKVFSYLNIPFIKNFDVKIANWLYPKLFKKYIKHFGPPQIIHVHGYEAGLAALEIKNRYQIPYLITEHSSKFVNNKLNHEQIQIAKKVFSYSSLNIAVSNYFALKLNSMFKLAFTTIPNLVKTEEIIKEEIVEKQYQMISVGAFNENKNQILILQTLAKYKFGKVLIVGEGPNQLKLQSFVKDNKLETSVDFLPFLPRTKLLQYMKQAVCLVITSNHETFGVVAIEALSCGIPVISTNAGGPADIIVDGLNGYIFENNPDSLYNAYCKVSKNLVKFAPSTLKSYVENHFSEKAVAQQLLTTYTSILK